MQYYGIAYITRLLLFAFDDLKCAGRKKEAEARKLSGKGKPKLQVAYHTMAHISHSHAR